MLLPSPGTLELTSGDSIRGAQPVRIFELCEDVDFARRLKRRGEIACLRSRVVTSARRWRQNGIVRTVLRMWLIKSLFLAGVSPAWLHRFYADVR